MRLHAANAQVGSTARLSEGEDVAHRNQRSVPGIAVKASCCTLFVFEDIMVTWISGIACITNYR
jgi:hypothetical protein